MSGGVRGRRQKPPPTRSCICLTVLFRYKFHNIGNLTVDNLTQRIQSGSRDRSAASEALDRVRKDSMPVDQSIRADLTIGNGFPEWFIRNHSIHLNIIEMLT